MKYKIYKLIRGVELQGYIRKLLLDNTGGVMIYALLLLMLGSLMVPPLLSLANSGLQAATMYERKTDEIYAADSGVEDALWRVKYGDLDSLFTSPAYDVYDYTTLYGYTLPNQVNGNKVDVSIQNIWIPKGITPLTSAAAQAMVEAGKLIVTGNNPDATTYQIRITYYPDDTDGDLFVETLGIWLPVGFTYVTDSSNLEDDPLEDYYTVPTPELHCGGQAIIWDLDSTLFAILPGVNPIESPWTAEIEFEFTSAHEQINPAAVAWMTTSGVNDIQLAWDADTTIFEMVSTAGDATAEAHAAQSSVRKLGSAIEGDYRAIGNTLMRDTQGNDGIRDVLDTSSDATVSDIPADANVKAAFLYWSGWLGNEIFEDDCHDMSHWSSSGNYWRPKSQSFRGHAQGSTENKKYMTLKKAAPQQLDLDGYPPGTVLVEWKQWEAGTLEVNDCLKFGFSGNDGDDWSGWYTAFCDDGPDYNFEFPIPDAYLTEDFTMRFYLEGFADSDEYCWIDDIFVRIQGAAIEADTSAVFKIDDTQVYLDGDGNPQTGGQEITASTETALMNESGYSYCSYLDVTELVQEYSDNRTGNAKYTVGEVNGQIGDAWSYAAWSLLIIYNTAETDGHQIYLYDDFVYAAENSNIDFDDSDGDSDYIEDPALGGDAAHQGGRISGFIVPDQIPGETIAAKITCFVAEGDDRWNDDEFIFNGEPLWDGTEGSGWENESLKDVWNSQSIGLTEDGVDIDTFEVAWDDTDSFGDPLLEPGDSFADIEMPTGVDSWNLIYIILSVRSETLTPGAMDYLLEF